jgi:hypothetical protein
MSAQRMIDDAQIYCRDAVASLSRGDYEAASKILLTRCRKLDMALQSLTPGGSEYVGDPNRCVTHAKEQIEKYREMWRDAMLALKEAK